MSASSRQKQLQGVVMSSKMEKTAVVSVTRTFRHPLYKRVVKSTKKYVAHDIHSAREGDVVRIEETRPLSKRKRWRVLEIVTRAK